MVEIYRHAKDVMIWLGQEKYGSYNVMDWLANSAAKSVAVPRAYHSATDTSDDSISGVETFTVHKRRIKKHVRARDVRALAAFFGKPWFNRVCVVRELLLAKNVRFFTSEYVLILSAFKRGVDTLTEYEDALHKRNHTIRQGIWEDLSQNLRSVREPIESRSLVRRSN